MTIQKKIFIYSKDEPYTEKGLQHMLSDLMKDKLIGEKLWIHQVMLHTGYHCGRKDISKMLLL